MTNRLYHTSAPFNSYWVSLSLLFLLTSFFSCIYLVDKIPFIVKIALLLFFYTNCKKDNYKLWMGILWIMIMGSAVYSSVINNQPFFEVTKSSYFAMGLLSFFIFKYYNLTYKTSIKLFRTFSIIFCVCYLFQFLIYPIPFFEAVLDKFSVTQDSFRMRMTCSACSYCLYFYGINKYMSNYNRLYLVYTFLGFVPIVIMGFRSLIFLTLIFTVYLILAYNWKTKRKLLIHFLIFGIISILLLQIPLVQYKIDEMMKREETEQTLDNMDYIRYQALDYYIDVYDTPSERLFGGGVPLVGGLTSSNNHYVTEVIKGYQMLLYWNDLGLIGFAFIFGFPSAILLSYLIARVIIRSKERPILFIRATLLTIFFGSIFTSQELYRDGNLLFIGLLMYIDYKYHLEKDENRNTNVSLRL